MKTRIVCFLVVLCLLVPTVSSARAPVFSVKPGYGIQSSHIGLPMGRVTPYIGFDLLAIGVKANYSESDWYEDWPSGDLYRGYSHQMDLSGSAKLLIPHLGAKFALSKPDKKLRPYLVGDLFKAFASVNVEGEDVYKEYDSEGHLIYEDVDKTELEKKEEEAIEKLLSIWGITLGFGVEYPLSEYFSIGGEYGLRMYFSSTDYDQTDHEDYDDDGIDDWREEWNGELSGSLKMSYACATLNFYF